MSETQNQVSQFNNSASQVQAAVVRYDLPQEMSVPTDDTPALAETPTTTPSFKNSWMEGLGSALSFSGIVLSAMGLNTAYSLLSTNKSVAISMGAAAATGLALGTVIKLSF